MTIQGKDKPVIMKALVELDGPRSQPFQAFAEQREKWMLHDMYRAPGKHVVGSLGLFFSRYIIRCCLFTQRDNLSQYTHVCRRVWQLVEIT